MNQTAQKILILVPILGLFSLPALGAKKDALSISLSKAPEAAKTAKLRVELRNEGAADLVLNLGIILANGKRQYPNAITISIKDSKGTTYQLVAGGEGGAGGRVDAFVVPLPAKASMILPVDLDKYYIEETASAPKPGTYIVQAHYQGVAPTQPNRDLRGIMLMQYWTGKVDSNRVSVTIAR